MAARVQLKLKSEFAEFTSALLDQLLPNYLAPIPSATLVQADAALRGSRARRGHGASRAATISTPSMSSRSAASPAGSGCAAISSSGRCTSRRPNTMRRRRRCRRSASRSRRASTSGLRLGFRRLTAHARAPRRRTAPSPSAPVKDVKVDVLPIHILGPVERRDRGLRAAVRQLPAHHASATSIRSATRISSPRRCDLLEQIGFGEDETLFEHDDRVFSGFNLLRDFFTLPEQVPRLQAGGSAQAAVADRCAGLRPDVRILDRRVPRLALGRAARTCSRSTPCRSPTCSR